jgi:hypothetical protein
MKNNISQRQQEAIFLPVDVDVVVTVAAGMMILTIQRRNAFVHYS